jgi:acyl-CoA hydrolase
MNEEVLTRKVSESQSERSEIVLPADSNAIGSLFGGRLMQYIDLVGAMAASRHARAFTVTASMDHLDFVAPVRVGELLILKASVNRAFRTSMEVGVRVMVRWIGRGTSSWCRRLCRRRSTKKDVLTMQDEGGRCGRARRREKKR